MGRKSSRRIPTKPVPEATPPSSLPAAVESSSGEVAAQTTATSPISTQSKPNSDSDTIPEPPLPNPTPKSKKSKPAEKRPVDENQAANTTTKRAKKDSTPRKTIEPENEPEKKLFQRLWSFEDEVTILQGVIDYEAENGVDPLTNADDFLVFIKNYSLHVPDANKDQLVRKVRGLKDRFPKLSSKKKITDPHEMKLFELLNKVMASDGGDDRVAGGDGEGTSKRVSVRVQKAKEQVAMDMDVSVGVVFGFDEESAAVLKEAVKRVEGDEKREIKTVVDNANVAYLNAFLMRLKALKLAAKKMLGEIQN